MTASKWCTLDEDRLAASTVSGTVSDLVAQLLPGSLSARTWLTLQRCGAANQPADWLLRQLAGVQDLLADGRSLAWVCARKRQRDVRVPEIVYCRALGQRGLLEILAAFAPILNGTLERTGADDDHIA